MRMFTCATSVGGVSRRTLRHFVIPSLLGRCRTRTDTLDESLRLCLSRDPGLSETSDVLGPVQGMERFVVKRTDILPLSLRKDLHKTI